MLRLRNLSPRHLWPKSWMIFVRRIELSNSNYSSRQTQLLLVIEAVIRNLIWRILKQISLKVMKICMKTLQRFIIWQQPSLSSKSLLDLPGICLRPVPLLVSKLGSIMILYRQRLWPERTWTSSVTIDSSMISGGMGPRSSFRPLPAKLRFKPSILVRKRWKK